MKWDSKCSALKTGAEWRRSANLAALQPCRAMAGPFIRNDFAIFDADR